MSWLGIDIGGANIKLSDGVEYAHARPFSMWKRPQDLSSALRHAIAEAPACDHLAVTMTGELADCFESKSVGVDHILSEVERARDGRHTRIYLSDGRFVTVAAAARHPLRAAASNWHALATYVRRFVSESGLLIDMGSTTTDLIPLSNAAVLATGSTDTERLVAGELWYSGAARNPVCAVVSEVPYRGQMCSVAQEYFATMRDVYVVTGKLPEAASDNETADGKPATKSCARTRLGRVICADESEFHHRDAAQLAEAVSTAQAEQLATRIEEMILQNTGCEQTIVTSGQGEFVVHEAIKLAGIANPVVSLVAELGARASSAATAHALAVLATELGSP